MAAKKKKPKKSRSGATISETARRERGQVQRKVRISAAASARLDELVADSGYPMSEFVEGMIDAQHDEWRTAQHKISTAKK